MNESAETLVHVLYAICDELPKRQRYLCDLDAAIGDGDHGVTITRCCVLVRECLDGLREGPGAEELTASSILDSVGKAVITAGGGAAGPLLGTALIEAGRPLEGKPEVRTTDVPDMLDAALHGLQRIGHASPGDRTMLDALQPAVEAAHQAAHGGGSLTTILEAAADAAEAGAAATASMLPRVGRAARFGEGALGHPDPGAVTVSLMLRAAADRIAESADSKGGPG